MALGRGTHVLVVPPVQIQTLLLAQFSSSPHPHPPASFDPSPPNEALISSAISILTEQHSKSRWNFLKSLRPAGFSPAEFSHIALRIKNNPRLALRFFLWSQHHSLCSHDLLSYSTIIHILARSRRFKTPAKTLIRAAIRLSGPEAPDRPPEILQALAKTYRACDSAPFVFDLVIHAFLDARAVDLAVEIARVLRSRGIHPSTGTCNSVIRSVARSGGSASGFAVYREIFGLDVGEADSRARARVGVRISPNLQTFNTLMLLFYREGKIEGMGEVRSEMAKFGYEANVFTYCVMMEAACVGGKIEAAVELWDEMRTKGIKPDIMAYNTLISGFCDVGEIEKAELLYREMVFGEIEPTCATFENLIRCYCKLGDVDLALVLYEDMCRRDYRPEAPTVDAVVGAMCRANRVFEGLEFLRAVKRRGPFSPGRASYAFLVKGFCQEGKMEEALKIQAEMVGRGHEPDLETYNNFIEGYKNQGNIEMAKKLRNELFEMGLVQEDEDG